MATRLDKENLLETVKSLWPDRMDLSADPDVLNRVYWANESAHPREDDWLQLAMWAFHQAPNEHADAARQRAMPIIAPSEIGLNTFDKWMRANLDSEHWARERNQYDAQ